MDEISERTTTWSSSENNANNAWNVNMSSGNMNNNNKFSLGRVRSVSALPRITFDIPPESVFEAFFDCVRHKMSAPQCAEFCVNYFPKLIALWQEIREGSYRPSTSDCFLVSWPTWREIFAAAFRDRIVHHWICLREIPLFEDLYHEIGDVSFNCRKDYGTLRAVKQFARHIWECSAGYTTDCWILELDIKSFFMSLSKSLLWEMTEEFLRSRYDGDDLECLLYLHRTTIFHCPQDDCNRKTPRAWWSNLPADKSLFTRDRDTGTAIGNHTAQQWANFYNSVLDYYAVHVLGFEHYIRFVDDMRIVCRSKMQLLRAVPKIRAFLSDQLLLTLHPKKVHIRHYGQGGRFVGAVVKKGRIYISNRTRGALVTKIHRFNALADAGRAEANIEQFVCVINSYYGLMIHYKTYTLRRKYALWILERWSPYLYFTNDFRKAVVKSQYRKLYHVRASIRKGNISQFFTDPYTLPDED